MIKIGIDARLAHYRVGGISNYTRNLIQALEQLQSNNNGEETFTVFQSRRSRKTMSDTFNTAKLWTPPHHRYERTALSVELLRHGLDIWHSPDFIPPRRGGKRHIITVHDLTFLHYPQHKDKDSRRYYNDQIRHAVMSAHHILAVSEATKTDLIEMLKVPGEKIIVQPHGVEDKFRSYSPQRLMMFGADMELRLPERGYILFVGTLEPRKNIPALLDAYETLHNRLSQVPPLLMVGQQGWLFDTTMNRIQKMQADGKEIILRHDIGDDLLPLVYNLASVLVLPSFYEGFGMPVLEAMACGIPTIVSNCSSLPEVAGDAAALIDPDNPDTLTDALIRALTSPEWRQQASSAGLRRAAKFTWENSAQIALSVYRSVMKA